jgi:hypothetical protein
MGSIPVAPCRPDAEGEDHEELTDHESSPLPAACRPASRSTNFYRAPAEPLRDAMAFAELAAEEHPKETNR